MKLMYEIPSSFWSLFRSVNREIYMEALLTINEEYQYNNYFLSREACIQILTDLCNENRILFITEETETLEESEEALPKRILNWLVQTKWLRKIEDYTTMTTNVVIPDYAAVFIDAFEQLVSNPMEDTNIYIQNVYATLFSFKNDSRMNIAMLKTALVNTKKLNKALQDMLHNMDKFFERLLKKQSYADLLEEHLEGYVKEVVNKKYHILKTSDNFYIYKMDIKNCLKEMREDENWLENIRWKQQEAQRKAGQEKTDAQKSEDEENSFLFRRRQEDDVLELIDQIERGFDDIEHRIANMDKEHSKYVRATVSRLNYLLSDESDRKGLMVQVLNHIGSREDSQKQDECIAMAAERMNLSSYDVLSDNPLYKRRRRRKFTEELVAEENSIELSKDEILKLNKIQHRFTKKQIEEFIEAHMTEGVFEAKDITLKSQEDFQKLILAYDMSIRKNSCFIVETGEEYIENDRYRYPNLRFIRKAAKKEKVKETKC